MDLDPNLSALLVAIVALIGTGVTGVIALRKGVPAEYRRLVEDLRERVTELEHQLDTERIRSVRLEAELRTERDRRENLESEMRLLKDDNTRLAMKNMQLDGTNHGLLDRVFELEREMRQARASDSHDPPTRPTGGK